MNNFPHRHHKHGTSVESAGLDAFELGLLAVARHFIVSFAAPETQSWTVAFKIASERWGISEGARAAATVLVVIEEMRLARKSVFRFSDPNCPNCRQSLTPNERHLMLILHAIRRGRVGDAQTEAMLLCEGEDAKGLLRAAWGLAGLFPCEKSAASPRQTEAVAPNGWHLH